MSDTVALEMKFEASGCQRRISGSKLVSDTSNKVDQLDLTYTLGKQLFIRF